jgi:serine phosphatase RsbU (regulator of sigma subunit)
MALTALMLITVIQGIREQGQEGWAALPAMLLAGISEFYTELQFLHILNYWFPFGIQITTRQVANLLLVVVLAALLLRRLVLSIRRQRQLALDVKQAQEVQQVILPEARLALPGLTIESEYRPAREVGGDFFQIIPHKTDGSLLIVAGDVTGKGLKAGMLVALLVGAIRSIAQFDPDPTLMLWSLNQRLMGRNDAQATCLALRIASDGAATLANAGHIAPYLNGEPIAMEGALPLGMMESAEVSLMHFQLKPDDKLVLMSDGIAEATDAEGHLFGFERVHELLRRAKSAAEVANAAESFGQEDDISVISVTRTLVHEPALA